MDAAKKSVPGDATDANVKGVGPKPDIPRYPFPALVALKVLSVGDFIWLLLELLAYMIRIPGFRLPGG